jgi:hypothetical protein
MGKRHDPRAQADRNLRSFDCDLRFPLLRFRALGQDHFKDTVLEVRLDLVGIHAIRHLKGALSQPESALPRARLVANMSNAGVVVDVGAVPSAL